MLSTTPYLTTRRPSPTTVEYTVSNRPPPTLSFQFLSLFLFLLRATAILAALGTLCAKWNQPPCTTGLFPHPPSFRAPEVVAGGFTLEDDGQIVAVTNELLEAPDSRSVFQVFPGPAPQPEEEEEIIGGAMEQLVDFEPELPSCGTLPILAAYPFWQRLLLSLPFGGELHDALSRAPIVAVLVESLVVLYVALLRVHATESLLVLRGLGIQTSSAAAGSLLRAPASTRFIPTEKIQDVLVNEAFRGSEVRHYLLIVVEGEDDVVVVFPKLLPGKDVVTQVWRGVKSCLYEKAADGMKTREI